MSRSFMTLSEANKPMRGEKVHCMTTVHGLRMIGVSSSLKTDYKKNRRPLDQSNLQVQPPPASHWTTLQKIEGGLESELSFCENLGLLVCSLRLFGSFNTILRGFFFFTFFFFFFFVEIDAFCCPSKRPLLVQFLSWKQHAPAVNELFSQQRTMKQRLFCANTGWHSLNAVNATVMITQLSCQDHGWKRSWQCDSKTCCACMSSYRHEFRLFYSSCYLACSCVLTPSAGWPCAKPYASGC